MCSPWVFKRLFGSMVHLYKKVVYFLRKLTCSCLIHSKEHMYIGISKQPFSIVIKLVNNECNLFSVAEGTEFVSQREVRIPL